MAKKNNPIVHSAELVDVSSLVPHPKNYRKHPPEQLAHIIESIKKNGVYKNVVLANDNTILAGHGTVDACKQAGIQKIPAVKLNLKPDDKRALKILVGDNEAGDLAETMDRELSDLLRDIALDTDGLLGTGFDDKLSNLLYSTSHPEITDPDPNAQWSGMPQFKQEDKTALRQIIVSFKTAEDVEKFAALIGQGLTNKTRSIWFPKAEIETMMDKRYVDAT